MIFVWMALFGGTRILGGDPRVIFDGVNGLNFWAIALVICIAIDFCQTNRS